MHVLTSTQELTGAALASPQVLLSYGELSAGAFLYMYGWLPGGDRSATGATSPHDEPTAAPHRLWGALTPRQREVLTRFQLTPARLGVDAHCPTVSPFKLPAAQAAAGKTTTLMRQVALTAPSTHASAHHGARTSPQVALIASCTNEVALAAIAQTGKMGDEHGVSAAAIGARVTLWLHEHVTKLCEHDHVTKLCEHEHVTKLCKHEAAPSSAVASTSRCRLSARLRRGERERLLQWYMALAEKHGLAPELVASVKEACDAAGAATNKAFKKALKKHAGDFAVSQSR